MAALCGAAITACGDGTANLNNHASAGKPDKSAVVTPNATSTFLAPISASTANSISGNLPSSDSRVESVTVSWAAPTENTDGSALTDLSGYEIYYGTSASELTEKVNIDTVGLSNYVIENLASGTWYFEVVAVNTLGCGSSPSSMVSVTI